MSRADKHGIPFHPIQAQHDNTYIHVAILAGSSPRCSCAEGTTSRAARSAASLKTHPWRALLGQRQYWKEHTHAIVWANLSSFRSGMLTGQILICLSLHSCVGRLLADALQQVSAEIRAYCPLLSLSRSLHVHVNALAHRFWLDRSMESVLRASVASRFALVSSVLRAACVG